MLELGQLSASHHCANALPKYSFFQMKETAKSYIGGLERLLIPLLSVSLPILLLFAQKFARVISNQNVQHLSAKLVFHISQHQNVRFL